jgi:hypothetical protein
MTLRHDDIQPGDTVYNAHGSHLYSVQYKDSENLLLKKIGGHPQDPQKLIKPVGGLHYGLQSYGDYKAMSRLLDQLNGRK